MYLNVSSVSRPQVMDATIRATIANSGAQANKSSFNSHLSADGRYVLFESDASNLVAEDTNNMRDVFRKDLATGEIIRVSTTSSGVQGNYYSINAQLSADGRYALFTSPSSNLVAGDTNNWGDIFRKDLGTGEIIRVSVLADGTQANSSSDNAQFSADGRYVLFTSFASNLVAGDTNNKVDIFRKDLITGEIIRVSVTKDGTQANDSSGDAQMSADGRYIMFTSYASNLVLGDTNDIQDIFRKDLLTGEIIRVSTTTDGAQLEEPGYNAQLSTDGRYVLFDSSASNLVANDTNDKRDIFRKDLVTGEIIRISTTADGTQTYNDSYDAQMSANNRYVVFTSLGISLVKTKIGAFAYGFDIYRKDLVTGELVCVSATIDGNRSNGISRFAQISEDGRYVSFESDASNLVANDTNNVFDTFRVDLLALSANQSRYGSNLPAILQGRYVDVKLGVGTASSVMISWGDGTSSTVTPSAGNATFNHTYASTGSKAATVTLVDGALTWKVAHTLDLASSTMVRNTAVADMITGGAGKDTINGDSFANILDGNGGNDALNASTGNDRLIGGTGKDTLAGGLGRDVFVFDDRETSASKSSADYIVDFSGKQGDKIDLKLVDANTKKSGDQAFSFIAKKAFSKAGEVRYEKVKGYTYVYLNTDSDKAAEAVIKIKGAMDLQKSWFVL
jgi:Ca2+-binding RTX toxin-like protein